MRATSQVSHMFFFNKKKSGRGVKRSSKIAAPLFRFRCSASYVLGSRFVFFFFSYLLPAYTSSSFPLSSSPLWRWRHTANKKQTNKQTNKHGVLRKVESSYKLHLQGNTLIYLFKRHNFCSQAFLFFQTTASLFFFSFVSLCIHSFLSVEKKKEKRKTQELLWLTSANLCFFFAHCIFCET